MMTVMEATRFSDPLRERDLADYGIEATVRVEAGPPRRLIVEMDPADWDRLVGRYGWAQG